GSTSFSEVTASVMAHNSYVFIFSALSKGERCAMRRSLAQPPHGSTGCANGRRLWARQPMRCIMRDWEVGHSGPAARSVSVWATGRVSAEPHLAQIAAGVMTEADTAKAARARNGAEMAAVIEGLRAAGIAPRHLRTTDVTLEPRFTRLETGRT